MTAIINELDLTHDGLLPELSKRLGATLRLPEPAWYARACAAGASSITAQRSPLSNELVAVMCYLPDVLADRPWGVVLTGSRLWLANPAGGEPLCCCKPEAWTAATMSACDERDIRIGGIQPCILAK